MTKRCVFVLAAAWLVGAGPAQASVERIQVQSREPFHTSVAGPYVKVTGTFTGSLDPRTEPIPGIERAPVRADERVEYASDFIVLFPESPASGNRVLLFDVENNGRPVVHGMYNSPIESVVRQLEIGNGFLEDHGFIVAVTSWQDGQGITLPQIRGADGTSTPLFAAGFAAVRDFAAFLRFETQDRAGTANPIAGRTDRAIALAHAIWMAIRHTGECSRHSRASLSGPAVSHRSSPNGSVQPTCRISWTRLIRSAPSVCGRWPDCNP